MSVAYRKENNNEFLEGTWNGFSKDNPGDLCIPGRVILSKTVSGLNEFLHQHRDSIITTEPLTISDNRLHELNFDTPFLDTEPKKVTEISVNNPNLQIQLIDYLKVDNDTVSIYLNRNILARNIRITKRASLINFSLDPNTEMNEILLYAENLGEIPPNTSELIVIDGERKHRVMISSDKQKTAAVYLKFKIPKNKK